MLHNPGCCHDYDHAARSDFCLFHTTFGRMIATLIVKKYWKYAAYSALFAVWLLWDLHQAYGDRSSLYPSYEPASLAAAKTSAATVSIVRSNDPSLTTPWGVGDDTISEETIAQMVRRAVELSGGLRRIIKSGDTVLIKPNLVQQDSSGSGGITDVRVVKALVYLIDEIDHGRIKIIVGDGSARPFTTFEKNTGATKLAWTQLFDVPGYQHLKTAALASGIDFRLSNLNGNSDTDPWPELDSVTVPNGCQATPQNNTYFVHKDVTHASVYITVPVLKIHEQPGFTCALKNQIGLAAGSKYGFSKTSGVTQDKYAHKLLHSAQDPYNWQDKEIVDLSSIARIHFVVVDAITCLETQKSPVYAADRSNRFISNRVVMNTIIAGEDPVAVDNVCCRVIGVNPDDIEHITLAERVGLGTNDPDRITVVGSTIEAAAKRFKKPTGQQGLFGQSNRIWILNGPYVASGSSDITTPFIPSEATAAPAAGQNGWSQPIYFRNDQIMLKEYFGLGSSGKYISYAFTYVISPADQKAVLWLGSDEALRVYLNGQPVYTYSGTRIFTTAYFSDTTTVVTLKKGINTLLVKAYQSTASYNFSLNICEVEPAAGYRGSRVTGLQFVSSNVATGLNAAAEMVSSSYRLDNCYPNPFNPSATIGYHQPAAGHVDLRVFDAAGREVTVLVDGVQTAGSHRVTFDGARLPSGVYLCRLRAGTATMTRKLLMIK